MNASRPAHASTRERGSINPRSPPNDVLSAGHKACSSHGGARNFQSLFCEQTGCSRSDYEDRMFGKCLYWHAKPIASVLRHLRPDVFDADLHFIRFLGEATDLREANASALDFQDANLARPNFLRRRLKIRVSGRSALRVAYAVFRT